MFIEKLWNENPELVKKAVIKIFDIKEERGDSLEFVAVNAGSLQFIKYGHNPYSINLGDFEVYTFHNNNRHTISWLKFMYKVFGDKYINEYITYRNNCLDQFMRDYETKYTNDTIDALAELGIKKYQDMQNQTK